ncbi:uncharacterized protein LOC128244694 isoform X2 [Mya arenaria]|uniref:uncharacterized protein LOC128244694 isoform X2 n=1 Tax=Mya arenaria TaxID=6604 RepID=UPI0022E6B0F7|nr:uncharacterized protein LOC128244694 isoform X2 [Mya arenaria]XP_052818693.1 uncharacterized protein LOC128244694 isoform X2 [Mya arenaria]XP_052818694.1 uncharacterized protein LOC128244694 isoform X2 [Mya arenaria]
MAWCRYNAGVREVMTDFWREHSQEASLEEMMLDSNAQELTKHELPEILSYLPSWESKDVIELGAGIGRFTAKLAATAKHVTAIDFMEKFINKNQETNGHIPNIDFRCEDVTKLRLENNSCDLVFSNWLMMYLEDEEVHSLINKELSWIREGGYLFARESCFGQSGNKKRSVNPTKYRDPSLYMAMFTMITIPTENEDEVFGFELVLSRSLTSYIKMKHNPNQVVWLLQKLRRKASTINNGYKTFQEFLDNQQYSLNGILRYEKIFGRTFVSTGGIDTTKDFVSRLDLQPGQVVLDIGCGIGGSAFYMVKEFGVKVVAIDLSANMINIGMDRAREMDINEDEVQFEIADATKREYEPNTFDVIYSRDTILHIPDKLALFKQFFKWLKPGGKLFISDYCCSDGDHSDQFKDYVKQRGYNLLSPARYGKVLEEAGFTRVDAQDRTDLFVQSLEKELIVAEDIREDFVKEFSQDDFDYIVNGWKDKVGRTQDQRWGVFYAEKN